MSRTDLLKPAQVFAEYGVKPRALAYMREQSNDLGYLIGPLWINPKDTNIFFYKRIWIEEWIVKDTVKFDVPELQNDKTDKSNKSNSNILKYPKHPK